MKRKLLEIYALVVCFLAVGIFSITLALASWNVVEVTMPDFAINNYEYECHQSDEQFKECYSAQHKYTRNKDPLIFPSNEALTSKRKFSYEQALNSKERQSLQELVRMTIILFINLFVFIGHWFLAGRARKS